MTTYDIAVHWLNNNYILCNNIVEVDPSIYEDLDTECYQYYLSDCSLEDIIFLTKNFSGIYFAYSEVLDLYVLCVPHYGTSWDYVPCTTTLEAAKAKLGTRRKDLK